VAGITAFSVPGLHTLTIDFSLEKARVAPEPEPSAPKPLPRKMRRPPPPPVKEAASFPDTTPADTAADTAEFAEDRPVQVASTGSAAAPQDTGLIREGQRQRYLKEQFEYIRDIIYRKAVYPPAAIDMTITGTVLLSFCVREDGGVGSIDIVKGSGAPILDRDAVSTIRRAAPFPRPPVRVVVKFPMEYRLE